MDNRWMWADLTSEQLRLVMQAEKTLGNNVKYLVAYQQAEDSAGNRSPRSSGQQRIATLSESQMECLQGLEKQLSAVVVAYQ